MFQTLRLHFSKTGYSKYLSHLDLVRCFTRAVKRSGLNAWYTEGYNRHLYLMFALPLALGIESTAEAVDIRLQENASSVGEILHALNCLLPKGIEVLNLSTPLYSHKEITSARYILHVKGSSGYLYSFKNCIDDLFAQPQIPIEKKMGGKTRVLNIKDQIHSWAFLNANRGVLIDLIVDAGNERNLNPMVVYNLAADRVKGKSDGYSLIRTGIIVRNGDNFE